MSVNNWLRASVGSIAIVSAPAFAQDMVDAGDQPGALDEIVVTAQKREETAQSTPLSITAISGQDILDKAQGSLTAVLDDAPGVELQGLAQGTQIYIRGVGSSVDPTFADPAIALMVDGAYNGRTEGVESGAYDVERVEVLRGPQGTLYGRNASGGLINVITADPKLGEVSGYVQGQAGNYDLFRLEGAFNAPIGDELAVRVAGYREKRDGYVDDGSSDSDSWGARLKLLAEPAAGVRVVLKADIYRAKGKGTNTVPVPGSAGNLFFPPPFFVANFNPPLAGATNPPVCPGSPFVGCAPILRFPNGYVTADASDPWANDPEHVPGFIRRESETYSAQLDFDMGFATLTVLPAYTRSRNRLVSSFLFGSIQAGPDAAYAGGPAFPTAGGATYDLTGYNDQDSTTTYKSVEARLASNGSGPLKYVLGLYYLGSNPGAEGLETTGTTLGGTPYTLTNNLQAGDTLAAFGQMTYSLTDAFRVTGGLRYSRDKSSQGYSIAINGGTSGDAFSQSVSSTQWKLGLEYDLAPQSLLYAHVSTGFKQGGISPTFPATAFAPEKLVAYEIGSKNRFLDNRLQLNLAAFHYQYDNYQYQVFQTLDIIDATGANIGSNTFLTILNADNTTINGAEASVEAVLWRNARITGSVTYLDAKYGTAILPNNPFVNQGNFDLEGKQIQNSPKWSGNIGFEQGLPIGPGMLVFNVNSHLTTGYFTTPEQYLPGAYQKGFTRTDAGIRYESDGGWSIGAHVKNIENDAQTTYVYPAYRRFITSPRTFTVTAGYRF